VNTDLLVAAGGLIVLAIIGIAYGLYDERRTKKINASRDRIQ
jgi:uncharacterized membrane protein